jgi:quercetin dioxygenase-like cupin family protein
MRPPTRWLCVALLLAAQPASQSVFAQDKGVRCRPVSERTAELGCWIVANAPVGRLRSAQAYWYVDAFASPAAAESAKGPRGTVIDSFGKTWLMSIEEAAWQAPAESERAAEIGPLPVRAGEVYTAQYMEAVFEPGMTAPAHVHAGPEAWYTLTGETCLETPEGKQVGRAGSRHVIVPGGPPMHLTATGTEKRRALVLILYESSKPATTLVHDWTPKGLCHK